MKSWWIKIGWIKNCIFLFLFSGPILSFACQETLANNRGKPSFKFPELLLPPTELVFLCKNNPKMIIFMPSRAINRVDFVSILKKDRFCNFMDDKIVQIAYLCAQRTKALDKINTFLPISRFLALKSLNICKSKRWNHLKNEHKR